MSTLTQFLNPLRSATSLRGYAYSASATISVNLASEDPGALTANVWKSVLTVNAPGIFHGALVRHGDGTSRTVGCRVTIDGALVCTIDESTANANSNGGVSVGSAVVGVSDSPAPVLAPFKTLLVEVRASDTNTAVRHGVNYVVL
jgi:hypothetical protein